MCAEYILLIVLASLAVATIAWQVIALAVNYKWYWKEFCARLEPWTFQFRRHVARWWWADMIFAAIWAGLAIDLLVTTLATPFWAKALTVAFAFFVAAFFVWLLLHLGGFALRIIKWIKGVLNA